MIDVKSIGRPLEVPGAAPSAPSPAPGGATFGKVLSDSLAKVNQLQHEADATIESLATGGTATLHDTMLAVQKAELSFKLMMQVRNKIIDAYQEVVRMSV